MSRSNLAAIVSLVLAAGAILALACTTTLNTPSASSGIEGLVTIGPTCPVQIEGDESCADQPYEATIVVEDGDGLEAARITSDADGRFRVSLSPGTYTLVPQSDGRWPIAGEQTVEVASGRFTQVTVAYDSGIR